MLKYLAAVASLIFLISCSAPPVEQLPAEKPAEVAITVGPDEQFRTMADAVAEAHRTFPQFVKAFETSAWGEGDYIVRMGFFNTERQIGEDLFVTFEKFENDEITGVIESAPLTLKEFKPGMKVTKPIRELRDWMFVPEDGDHRGGYTLRTLPEESSEKKSE